MELESEHLITSCIRHYTDILYFFIIMYIVWRVQGKRSGDGDQKDVEEEICVTVNNFLLCLSKLFCVFLFLEQCLVGSNP